LLQKFNALLPGDGMPYLAALSCSSAFDIALHDAYGKIHEIDVYQSYTSEFMNRDLSAFLAPADDVAVDFSNQYPSDYLLAKAPTTIPVWHLVGGLDPLTLDECPSDQQIDDGYPVSLADWVRSDGLKCLKVKLRGNDSAWDYQRLVQVGEIAFPLGVEHLSADFNCTVEQPAYVNDILDRLQSHHAEVFNKLLYVEQPFPYDLEANRYDVRSVAERKPLFLDESAHDWTYVRLGRSLGWSGVALKTCKTQSGSLLSLCWAKAHGMQLMVQDLSNPMLAQIPHVRLAAHADTIMGVESNSMQFYPEASSPEARIHPGLFSRRGGVLDLSTIAGSGFGYRLDEIARPLPDATVEF
jgi:L-alanine-DL-glutamate epimerase-like enolase superfamily enzyme